jgi:hypothetical protein
MRMRPFDPDGRWRVDVRLKVLFAGRRELSMQVGGISLHGWVLREVHAAWSIAILVPFAAVTAIET